MAKKRKSSQDKEIPEKVEIEDAVADEAVVEPVEEVVEPPVEDPEKAPETEVEIIDEMQVEDHPEEIVEPEPEPTPIVHETQDSASNSVFLPAILGGLIAAGIGFFAAYYFIPRFEPEMVELMAENEVAIADLRTDVAAIDPLAATAPLIAELSDQVLAQFGAIDERIALVEDRVLELEKQPSADGTLQETALQAYQDELDQLRAQVEEQAGAAFAQLESTREEAAAIEEASLLAARNAKARAALAQIRSSLETGAPMTNALTELEEVMGEPAPAGLTDVADGVPTLAKLQGDFPPAARQALSDSRSEGASGESSGAFGSFLREQLNVRSVAPRDGDDADAILSRAEAALKDGQLETALTEVAALPEVAAAPLAGWVNQAQARVDAVNAANDVSNSLNDN